MNHTSLCPCIFANEVVASPKRESFSVSWIYPGHMVGVPLHEFWSLGLNRLCSFYSCGFGNMRLPCYEEIQSSSLENEGPWRGKLSFLNWQPTPISLHVNETVLDLPAPVKLSDECIYLSDPLQGQQKIAQPTLRTARNNKWLSF